MCALRLRLGERKGHAASDIPLASIHKLTLEGMTHHGADQAKVLDTNDGSKLVTIFAG